MTRANLQLTDYDAVGRPQATDLEMLAAPLSTLLTQELDGAANVLGLASDEILIATLGRAIERTIGRGTVLVDVPSYGIAVHSLALPCAAPNQIDADEMLAGVHHALASLDVGRAVQGVPNDTPPQPVSQLLFANGASATTTAHLGHVLELRAYRVGEVMALDWWFDSRSFESYTVRELAEQFSLALIELTSDATPTMLATAELAMAH